ncbi:hypothetical protein HanXRQr2_Chr04g0187071 [Helianthus annuus]|uniref:Uncharacterized protein n=1 Tax=Helianthus annuus TaxID=4232 RepID=A0A9K3JBD2_HELAN|nr:hypothetical protein HanXRQr2_Chr04g0187071 [Helianthus annuus]KAJ0933059.1 hypothetical protein HanPSC8_Chr04g0180671 [Helianthus annuus]
MSASSCSSFSYSSINNIGIKTLQSRYQQEIHGFNRSQISR